MCLGFVFVLIAATLFAAVAVGSIIRTRKYRALAEAGEDALYEINSALPYFFYIHAADQGIPESVRRLVKSYNEIIDERDRLLHDAMPAYERVATCSFCRAEGDHEAVKRDLKHGKEMGRKCNVCGHRWTERVEVDDA